MADNGESPLAETNVKDEPNDSDDDPEPVPDRPKRTRYFKCAVPTCKNDSRSIASDSSFLFFDLPKSGRELWTRAIPSLAGSDPYLKKVCAIHFEDGAPSAAHPAPSLLLGTSPKKSAKKRKTKDDDEAEPDKKPKVEVINLDSDEDEPAPVLSSVAGGQTGARAFANRDKVSSNSHTVFPGSVKSKPIVPIPSQTQWKTSSGRLISLTPPTGSSSTRIIGSPGVRQDGRTLISLGNGKYLRKIVPNTPLPSSPSIPSSSSFLSSNTASNSNPRNEKPIMGGTATVQVTTKPLDLWSLLNPSTTPPPPLSAEDMYPEKSPKREPDNDIEEIKPRLNKPGPSTLASPPPMNLEAAMMKVANEDVQMPLVADGRITDPACERCLEQLPELRKNVGRMNFRLDAMINTVKELIQAAQGQETPNTMRTERQMLQYQQSLIAARTAGNAPIVAPRFPTSSRIQRPSNMAGRPVPVQIAPKPVFANTDSPSPGSFKLPISNKVPLLKPKDSPVVLPGCKLTTIATADTRGLLTLGRVGARPPVGLGNQLFSLPNSNDSEASSFVNKRASGGGSQPVVKILPRPVGRALLIPQDSPKARGPPSLKPECSTGDNGGEADVGDNGDDLDADAKAASLLRCLFSQRPSDKPKSATTKKSSTWTELPAAKDAKKAICRAILLHNGSEFTWGDFMKNAPMTVRKCSRMMFESGLRQLIDDELIYQEDMDAPMMASTTVYQKEQSKNGLRPLRKYEIKLEEYQDHLTYDYEEAEEEHNEDTEEVQEPAEDSNDVEYVADEAEEDEEDDISSPSGSASNE